jgi:hypothetical protein
MAELPQLDRGLAAPFEKARTLVLEQLHRAATKLAVAENGHHVRVAVK